LSVLPKAEDLYVFPKAEGVSDFQVWDIGQVTVSNFDWLPFTPPLVAFSGPSPSNPACCCLRSLKSMPWKFSGNRHNINQAEQKTGEFQ
jgi:hypothetical protein